MMFSDILIIGLVFGAIGAFISASEPYVEKTWDDNEDE